MATKPKIRELLDESACAHNSTRKAGCHVTVPGATSGGCAFEGAQITLFPYADAAHLVHGPITCIGASWQTRLSHTSWPGRDMTQMGLTTGVCSNDVVFGGEAKLRASIDYIVAQYAPQAVFVYSTCVTAMIGDDIDAVCRQAQQDHGIPMIPVHAPGFVGSKNLGSRLAGEAVLTHLVGTLEPAEITPFDINLIGEYNVTGDMWQYTPLLEKLGIRVLSTLSGDGRIARIRTALDGHLGHKQGALSSGGVTVDEIFSLAEAGAVISVGESVKFSAMALLKKNPAMRHMHLDHVQGLVATDNLVEKLMDYAGLQQPSPTVVRWRKRLQDVMLDSHFALGQTRIMVTGEPDFLAGACQSLTEAGARIGLVLSSVDSPQLGRIEAERVVVGDLEDAEKLQSEYDLIIGNFHAEALARRYGKALVPRGFPCWEMIGNQLKNDLLYEGGAYFLCEAANAAEAMRMQHHAV